MRMIIGVRPPAAIRKNTYQEWRVVPPSAYPYSTGIQISTSPSQVRGLNA